MHTSLLRVLWEERNNPANWDTCDRCGVEYYLLGDGYDGLCPECADAKYADDDEDETDDD